MDVLTMSDFQAHDKATRCRKWTDEEVEVYAIILGDSEHSFALNLEKLAMKKRSNKEMFLHIKKYLDKSFKSEEFIARNESNNFKAKDGHVIDYEPVDTSVIKLRKKYTNLKTEWRKLNEKIKAGCHILPSRLPKWFHHLNEIFVKIKEELGITSDSGQNKQNEETDDEEEVDHQEASDNDYPEVEIHSSMKEAVIPNTEDIFQSNTVRNGFSEKSEKISKLKNIVTALHHKRKADDHALSRLAESLENIVSSQVKKHRMNVEAELKREEMYLKHREQEAERNRQHELKIIEIYARAMRGHINQENNSTCQHSNATFSGNFLFNNSQPRFRGQNEQLHSNRDSDTPAQHISFYSGVTTKGNSNVPNSYECDKDSNIRDIYPS